jgi:triacylglycerol lipase
MRKILLTLAVILVVAFAGLAGFDRYFPEQAARIARTLERDRAHLSEHRVSIPGFEVAYLEGGNGEPLVLIHGSGADKDNWTRVARYLTPHYRVIALDLPGYGDSSKPEDARYNIPSQVARLNQFLSALGIQKAHLGGNSMGGFIAATYAAYYPEKVSSLWLLAPAGLRNVKESEARRIYRETGRSPLFSEKPEDFDRVLKLVMAKPPYIPHGIKHALAAKAVSNFRLHGRIYGEIYNDPVKLEDLLPGLETPTLVIWGGQDRVLDPSGADAIKDLLPQAKTLVLPGVGHVPMIEAPKASAQAFLREICRCASD